MDLRYRFAALFQQHYIGFFYMALIWAGISLVLLSLSSVQARRRVTAPFESHSILIESLLSCLSHKYAFRLIVLASAATALVGVGWKYSFIQRTELSSRFADMLPLILSACKEMLAGKNPYAFHHVPWELPLTFLPGLWLPYCLPYLMNIDIRWITVLTAIAIPVILTIVGLVGFKGLAQDRCELQSIFIVSVFASIVFFSLPLSLVSFSGIAHTSTLWLWIVLFAVFLLFDKISLASTMLAIALASRQTTIIYLFPTLVYFYRIYGLKKAFLSSSIIVIAVALICLPFAWNNLDMFLFAPIRHYDEMASHWMQIGTEGHVALNIGFGYMINLLLGENSLRIFRGAFFLIAMINAFIFVYDKPSLFLVLVSNGVIFSLLMPVSWHYVFFPLLFLLPFASFAFLLGEQNGTFLQGLHNIPDNIN